MTSRRYTLVMLICAALLTAAAAAFNVLVDPYNVFGSPAISGFNAMKPYAGDRGRVAKLHQVARVRPRTLIVGNSRPEMGLDPSHPCWTTRPVYNMGVPGLTVYKQLQYARHAESFAAVDLVVIGVDFVDYIEPVATRQGAPYWPVDGHPSARAAVDADGRPRARWAIDRQVDRFRAAVSLEALFDSVQTVVAQSGGEVATRTPLGFFPAEALYRPIVGVEGVAALFTQKNRQLAQQLDRELGLFAADANWSTEFEALRRYLESRSKAGKDTVLYASPLHAEFLLLLYANGLWEQFESWKMHMSEIAAEFELPFYDFAVFDSHATERVEDVAARGQSLRWFWEPSHYRAELGSRMIETMFPGQECAAGEPIGARLDMTNIETHNARVRARRDSFIDNYPQTWERLQRLGLKPDIHGFLRLPGAALCNIWPAGDDARIIRRAALDCARLSNETEG